MKMEWNNTDLCNCSWCHHHRRLLANNNETMAAKGKWKMPSNWYDRLDSLHWGLGATVEPDYVSNGVRRTYLTKGQWAQC